MNLKSIQKKIGFFLSPSSLIRTYRAITNAKRILELGNYREKCLEKGFPIEKNTNIWKHYKKVGFKKNINPCDLFDSEWYRSYYLINKPNSNPLLHYLVIGEKRGINTNSLIKPKVLFELLSNHVPKHKSYLLGLMEEFNIKNNNDIEFFKPNLFEDFQKIVNFNLCNLKNGISYLEENNINYTFLKKETFLDKECKFYLKNPFFNYNMPYYAIFNNVKIISGTADIFFDNKHVINDELFYSYQIKDIYGDPIKDLMHHGFFKEKLIIKNIEESNIVIKEGIHLTKEYNHNYFHFIFEVLAKLSYIEDNNIFPDNVPIIVSNDLHENIYKMIDIINVKNRKIIKIDGGKKILVNKLYYLSDITLAANTYNKISDNNVTIFPDVILNSLRKKILKYVENENSSKTQTLNKIYIPRKFGARLVLNENIIEKHLIDSGYEIIETQNLSFLDQVLFFSKAKVIMGPTGAAMTNLLWCSPHIKVVIFYPDHPFNNMSFWKIIAEFIGFDLIIITGQVQGDIDVRYPHCDYKIDIDKIKQITT